jgi:hypothetical protein
MTTWLSKIDDTRPARILLYLFICVQVRIFLLPAMPMRVGSRRSRLMMAGFYTGTHRCRSFEEAHSLLGWRVCVYRERQTLLQNSNYLWSIFWASSFINSNIWHLICNNFNLNFICGTVCLYVCVCAFSLCRELLIWSWETNPSFLRWFCHSWYQSKIRVKRTWKHLKIAITFSVGNT